MTWELGDPLAISKDGFVVDSALPRSLPTILEADVLWATALSPSASASSDYASIPFVQGGASDGTPVLLDGVRPFNTSSRMYDSPPDTLLYGNDRAG